jgi:transcriptional regulator with XRE-family HTH domain
MNQAEIIDEYRIDDLGAPFSVVLERSVGIVRGEHGPAPVIPDVAGLIYETVAARARHPRRLSGQDLLFMRRAASMTREEFGRSMGCDGNAVAIYEEGGRPVPAALDGLARIHAYHRIRRHVSDGVDRMVDFLDWIFGEYRYSPLHPAGEEMSFTLRYADPGGWTQVSAPSL